MSWGPDTFCCVGFAVGLSHRHESAAVPSGEFPFPVTRPVPGPGPQVRAREAFSAPTPPLTSPSLSALGGPGCTFPYLQHKMALCFFTPVTSTPQAAGDGRWPRGAVHPCQAEKAETAVPSLALCFHDLCG